MSYFFLYLLNPTAEKQETSVATGTNHCFQYFESSRNAMREIDIIPSQCNAATSAKYVLQTGYKVVHETRAVINIGKIKRVSAPLQQLITRLLIKSSKTANWLVTFLLKSLQIHSYFFKGC